MSRLGCGCGMGLGGLSLTLGTSYSGSILLGDGTSAGVAHTGNITVGAGVKKWTLAAHIYLPAASGDILMEYVDTSGGAHGATAAFIVGRSAANRMDFVIEGGVGAWEKASTNDPLAVGQWYRYVVTVDMTRAAGQKIRVYLDGVLQANYVTAGGGDVALADGQKLTIGCRYEGSALPAYAAVAGVVLDVGAEWSAAEVARYTTTTVPVKPAGATRALWLKCQDGTGTALTDSGGAGNSAALSGNYRWSLTYPGGPWSPLLVRGLVSAFRRSTGITTVAGDVSVWTDLSANALNATQPTAGNRPTESSGGANFTGATDALLVDNAQLKLLNQHTIYIVSAPPVATPVYGAFFSNGAVDSGVHIYTDSTSLTNTFYRLVGVGEKGAIPIFSVAKCVHSYRYDGATMKAHVNGVQVWTQNITGTVSTPTGSNAQLGGLPASSRACKALVDAILVYNVGHAANEMAEVVSMLKTDSGIT